jgi:hypothetical protein
VVSLGETVIWAVPGTQRMHNIGAARVILVGVNINKAPLSFLDAPLIRSQYREL